MSIHEIYASCLLCDPQVSLEIVWFHPSNSQTNGLPNFGVLAGYDMFIAAKVLVEDCLAVFVAPQS